MQAGGVFADIAHNAWQDQLAFKEITGDRQGFRRGRRVNRTRQGDGFKRRQQLPR